MRPKGDMWLKLGHEPAGLRDVLVPVRAGLGIALLGLEVDVEPVSYTHLTLPTIYSV